MKRDRSYKNQQCFECVKLDIFFQSIAHYVCSKVKAYQSALMIK